jgi:hypothetical protein
MVNTTRSFEEINHEPNRESFKSVSCILIAYREVLFPKFLT